MGLPSQTDPKNWTEDFSHENGNYICTCCYCGGQFLGHKRRVVCNVCHEAEKDPDQ